MFKFNYSFKIGKHKIKQFNKPYIIAEAGSNHNQRLGNAIKLSKIAKAAGCNAIKFQFIYPEGIAVGPKSKHGKLKNKFKIYSNNLFDLYSKCSLKFEEFKKVKSFCDKIKIDMLASVFCNRSLKDAIKLKLKAIKIASLELYDPLLLKSVAKSKKPIILSTGTSNINDIKHNAVREILCKDEKYIRVEVRNFGVIESKPAKAKPKARNPRTNEEIFVPAHKKTHFKPGKLLKEYLKKPI